MMWNLQSYPTTILNKRMWHFRASTHTLTPHTYFQAGQDPNPTFYAADGRPQDVQRPDGVVARHVITFTLSCAYVAYVTLTLSCDFVLICSTFQCRFSTACSCLWACHRWKDFRWLTSRCRRSRTVNKKHPQSANVRQGSCILLTLTLP